MNTALTETGAEPLVRVEDLSTHFDTAQGIVHAVQNVSFDLDAGRALGIVGESGCGKSVLARSLLDLLPSNAMRVSGRVVIDGHDVRRAGRRELRAIRGSTAGMVFQDPLTALNPVVRIDRHLTETMRFHTTLRASEREAHAAELLTLVGLPDAGHRLRSYPHELSGGMRQRVCIALALAGQPRLLIADEPTTALDVTIQRQILDLLASLQRDRGMAMILITHDLGVAAGCTDEIVVMYGGRVVEKASTAALFARPRHPYTAALLRSIPRLEDPPSTRLSAIPGQLSPMIDPPPGCAFAPRCTNALDRCRLEAPPLALDGPGHEVACFFPVATPVAAPAVGR